MVEKKGEVEKNEKKKEQIDYWAETKINPNYREYMPVGIGLKKTEHDEIIVLVFSDYYKVPLVGIALTKDQIKVLTQKLSEIQ
jgi:hypothetical protein